MKSRNLFLAAMTAALVGSVVLTPAFASAQSRDRDRDGDQDLNRYSGQRDNSSRNSRSNRAPAHLRGGYLGDTRNQSGQWNNRDRGNQTWGNRNGDGDWDDRNRNRDWDRDRDRDRNRNRDWDDEGDRDRDRDRRDRGSYGYGYGYSAPYYDNSGYYNQYPTYGNYGYNQYPNYRNQNDWRSIAELAGLIAVIGVLNHDDTLTFVGGAGALYSLYRYDQDRYSDDPACRLRAEYFSHPYFYRNGRRYDRVMVHRYGEDYYQFVCR